MYFNIQRFIKVSVLMYEKHSLLVIKALTPCIYKAQHKY